MTIHPVPSGENAYSQRLPASQISQSDAAGIKSASFADKLNQNVNRTSSSKVDTIELSSHPAKRTLSQIRDGIVSDLAKDKDAETIKKLQIQVSAGTYRTDSQELAERMLSADGD